METILKLLRMILKPFRRPAPPRRPAVLHRLPFVVHTYEPKLEPEPYTPTPAKLTLAAKIDPGSVPPNYVHTWAIDVRYSDSTSAAPNPTDAFFLGFDDLELDLADNGDVLTIVNSRGDVVAEFRSLSDLVGREFQCSFTEFDARPYKRLYLMLTTSDRQVERRFVLSHLATRDAPPEAATVVLTEDSVNYETTESFVEARGSDGNLMALYPPWSALAPTSGTTLEGAPIAFAKPLRGEGWFLLGLNVTDATPGFYTLLYYNEYESKLRAYLYNLDITGDASGFLVQFGMLCKNGAQYEYLNGPVFPVSPNSDRWSTGIATVPLWARQSWIMLELPVLYPMARNLPVADPAPAGGRYTSVYEERFAEHTKAMMLQVKVAPYQLGKARGDIIGRAIGHAIQQFGESGTGEILKGIYAGIKQGKDWSKGASDLADSLKNYLKKNEADWGSAKDIAAEMVSMSASALSGYLGAAGAALSLAQSFFFPKQPLQMTMELALTGQLTGEVFTELQQTKYELYLPGRFSITEAFDSAGPDRLPRGSRRYIETKIPRYDRPVGLFGYATDPSETVIHIYRLDRWPYGVQRAAYFLIPRCAVMPYAYTAKPWNRYSIPQLLPLVFNRFANVQPLPSDASGNSEVNDPSESSRVYCKAFFESPTSDAGVQPSPHWFSFNPYTAHDQQRGYELNIQGSHLPVAYRAYAPVLGVRVVSTVWRSQSISDGEPFEPMSDKIYMLIAGTGDGRSSETWSAATYDRNNLSPLHDVVYYWNLAYRIPSRIGGSPLARSIKLSAPVSVAVVRGLMEYTDSAQVRGMGVTAYPPTKSMMLKY